MNKLEVLTLLMKDPTLKCTKKQAEYILDAVLKSLSKGLKIDGSVELRTFGAFRIKTLPGKVARHPKPGQKMWIGPRKKVVFKPSKQLFSRVS